MMIRQLGFLNKILGIGDTLDKILSISLVVLAAIFIIYCFRFRSFRILFLLVIYLALIVTGILSAIGIDKYYSTSGGIWGKLTGVTVPNQVESNPVDLVFDFKDIVLTEDVKTESSNDIVTYQAKFLSDEVVEFNDNLTYMLYVNNSPVDIKEFSSSYLMADFEYNFYNESKVLLQNDVLKFSFAFYENSTMFLIKTNGGTSAANLWNAYFKKNSFVVSLKLFENPDYEVSTNICSVKFVAEDDILETVCLFENNFISVVPEIFSPKYEIIGWTLDKTTVVDPTTILISEDTVFYALYSIKEYKITILNYSGPNTDSNITSYKFGSSIDAPYCGTYSFYQLVNSETKEVCNLKNFKVTEDACFDTFWCSLLGEKDMASILIEKVCSKYNLNYSYDFDNFNVYKPSIDYENHVIKFKFSGFKIIYSSYARGDSYYTNYYPCTSGEFSISFGADKAYLVEYSVKKLFNYLKNYDNIPFTIEDFKNNLNWVFDNIDITFINTLVFDYDNPKTIIENLTIN